MRLRFIWLVIVLLGSWAQGAWAQSQPLDVQISVEGQDTKQIRLLLESISELIRIRKEGIVSLGAARRLTAGDTERFARALTSEGFYSAKIDSNAEVSGSAFRISFKIDTGTRYLITAHAIEYTDAGSADRPKSVALTGAALNDSARGPDILKVEKDFIARLRATGYPLARSIDRRAEVKVGSTNAKLVYMVESGPKAKFGQTVWQGAKKTHTDFLDSFVPWKPGEIYDVDRTDTMRDELSNTGLFTRVEVTPGPVDAEGNAPVIVDLIERKPRTIAGGLSYSTNLGPGVTASWEHRNLYGRAEKLSADIEFARVLQEAVLGYERPRLYKRTDLVTKLGAKHEDDDAFHGTTIEATAALKHKFGKSLIASAGVELSESETTDPIGGHIHSYLLAVPVGGVWSTVKDVLDPKRGLTVALTIAPNVGVSDGPIFFTQADLSSNYHWPIDRKDLWIGAVWARVGALAGPVTAEIPPEKRYYAGGAGSVRGYGYRLLGPTDVNNKPIGGRSVLEGGAELRFPVFHNFGGAIFVEAGGVDETGLFTFKEGIGESVGIGARYATGIGPIRVDFAVPLDRRPGIDKAFQIYVGLGQPF